MADLDSVWESSAPDFSPLAQHLFWSVIGNGLYMCLCVLLARRLFPRARDPKQARGDPGGDKWIGDALSGMTWMTCIACPGSSRAVFDLHGSVQLRFFGVSAASYWGCVCFVGRMQAHMVYMVWKGLNRGRKIILLHHVLVILVYGGGLVNSTGHFWGSLMCLCEVTNIFLMNHELFQSCTDVKKVKQGLLFRCNSLMLTLSYILFRLVLFPAVMVSWATDVLRYPEVVWYVPRVGLVEKFITPVSMLGVLVLSIQDFIPIHRGTLKTFGICLQGEALVCWCIILVSVLVGASIGCMVSR